ncbi:cytochrome c biogenesis protein ResB [Diaphorobacter caeni]|uniref:cytochrome c biogenesis protein ResB n=1 Tax=Diaphorobacter caeni TaxID=2784387 RepID=UPI0018906B6E|nr:cytochrome c biogenesis protein ResB [Diaphorobacter caeni]MBF5003854.1 cytochrome c biogenesis protein ResB [Diaphorobacter caeni]
MSDATLDASNASPSSPNWRSLTELLASMRFAISLLTVICIASVIGTVLKQHEPAVNYVNQFGPFWADLFLSLKLNAVYSAWWFLLILAFLVVSTSLCVARHAPKYLADIRNYKENIREKSLNAFHHKAKADLAGAPADEAQRLGKMLVSGGWKVKLQQRDTEAGPGTGWMLAAKAGAANKIGYIAAHTSIVLICLGGLFDGDLIVRAQMLLGGKSPYTGGGLISEVAPEHRLSDRNPTFRANLLVAEGTQSSTAILNQSDGVLLQELPFAIELKKFIVEYYSTGMPKLFASDIVIHDKETGEKKEARVEVNHPASYKGIEIYQSSFDDGGSKVQLQARSFQQGVKPFMVSGEIGGSLKLPASDIGGQPATLEFTALRVLNVENLSGAGSEVDVRKVDLKHTIESRLGAGNKSATKRDLRNVGPSITYKLRDASGQAREFVNYMLPVDTGDGQPVYLLGVRETPAEPFRYLRVPVDPEGGIDGFLHLREALADSALREQAVQRYTRLALDDKRPELSSQLQQSALRALTLFAEGDSKNGQKQVGLQAISDFIEANVPEAERARAGEVLVRILNGVLYELAQVSREKAGLKAMVPDEKTQNFMTQAVLTLSDVQLYPVPVFFELKNFDQVQASVFQVARAPGKNIVYLGCALLILGVFAMLYVRERRIWIWLTPAQHGAKATMALSTNRKTMDGDKEFEQLSGKLLGIARDPGGNAA